VKGKRNPTYKKQQQAACRRRLDRQLIIKYDNDFLEPIRPGFPNFRQGRLLKRNKLLPTHVNKTVLQTATFYLRLFTESRLRKCSISSRATLMPLMSNGSNAYTHQRITVKNHEAPSVRLSNYIYHVLVCYTTALFIYLFDTNKSTSSNDKLSTNGFGY